MPTVNAKGETVDLSSYSLEDAICAIIKDAYDFTGFEDAGTSDSAAHEIMTLLVERGIILSMDVR